MQNSPKCVVMETRYMVDTTSQELLNEEKTILKFTSSALFFSQTMLMAQVTLPIV